MSWNADIDPTNRIIPPTGLPLAVISTSCVFLVLGLVFTGIRLYIRVVDRLFGLDDWFMAGGCLTYIAAVGVGVAAELMGIGTLDQDLNQWQFEESKRMHTVWLCVYVVPMCLVKASICITLLRIVEARITLRYIVYGLLAVVVLAFIATFVGTLLQCQPIEAQWKPQLVSEGKATCAPIEIFVSLGYIATVAVIIIDTTLVVIPAMVLWDSLMSTQQKLQIFTMLSVGSAASLITIVRIPFVKRYSDTENQHYWIAMIVLCSHIETGIGLIAPSFPHLRRLVMLHMSQNQANTPQPPNTDDIVTIGRFRPSRNLGFGRNSFKNPTDIGISLTTIQANAEPPKTWRNTQGDQCSSDEGELLEDRAGQGIGAVHSYTVEYEYESDRTSSVLEHGKSVGSRSGHI